MHSEKQNNEFPIDAVITWVNGNDSSWQEKMNSFREEKIDFSNKRQSVRFNSIGEIDIAILSIIKYAGFVRNIFLVTDQQKPDAFDEFVSVAKASKINLVLIDHKTIFKGFEHVLPCFNSCSIGTMLYRVPNLAEHFIIFNDDTFLMRETTPCDFFIDGKPIVRGNWARFNEDRVLRKVFKKMSAFLGKKTKQSTSFKTFQQRSAKLAGTKKYVRRFHTPVSIRKSTVEAFFEGKEKLLEQNISHRFRNRGQFIISSLSEHLEIAADTYHYSKDTNLTYFRNYKNPTAVKKKLKHFLGDPSKKFMTFQSLETADSETLDYIQNWISERLEIKPDLN